MAARSVSHDPPPELEEEEDEEALEDPRRRKGKGKGKRALARPPRKSNPKAGTSKRAKARKADEPAGDEPSFASALTEAPQAFDPSKTFDYTDSAVAYKNYWKDCTDAYVFDIDEKKSLSINQLITAPTDYNIRDLEDRLVEDQLHSLMNTPNKSAK